MPGSLENRRALASVPSLALLVVFACGTTPEGERDAAKIPVTTVSEEARELFLQGRDLNDRLRFTDAHEYFEEAVELDPDFAWAHLLAGFTGSTAQEFWDDLELAVASAEDASEGERLLILATEAGIKGHPERQLEYLNELVAAYPGDERSHNALGAAHFGRQEYEQAVVHYQHAIDINPEFSPPYNQKGYSHRFLGDYAASETSFRKYVELIPDDPNPYDSYAELLMKMGRFDESIEKYREALAQDENFIASYIGIANNQTFMGRTDEARGTLDELFAIARNVGEERGALFWKLQSYLHDGDFGSALAVWDERYELATEDEDLSSMASDLNLKGDILLEAGRTDEAAASYAASIQAIEQAAVATEIKGNAKRNILFDEARTALARGDVATARSITERYGELVQAKQIPFELRLHHQLLGELAWADGDPASAVDHLEQANQRDPRVLFLLAQAHLGAGNREAARDYCDRAANFNALSSTYAYVRRPAQEMLASL